MKIYVPIIYSKKMNMLVYKKGRPEVMDTVCMVMKGHLILTGASEFRSIDVFEIPDDKYSLYLQDKYPLDAGRYIRNIFGEEFDGLLSRYKQENKIPPIQVYFSRIYMKLQEIDTDIVLRKRVIREDEYGQYIQPLIKEAIRHLGCPDSKEYESMIYNSALSVVNYGDLVKYYKEADLAGLNVFYRKQHYLNGEDIFYLYIPVICEAIIAAEYHPACKEKITTIHYLDNYDNETEYNLNSYKFYQELVMDFKPDDTNILYGEYKPRHIACVDDCSINYQKKRHANCLVLREKKGSRTVVRCLDCNKESEITINHFAIYKEGVTDYSCDCTHIKK